MVRHAIWPLFALLLIMTATLHCQCVPPAACSDPFSPAVLQQLQLTPQQAETANCIARQVNQGLRVPVYHGDQLNPYPFGDGLEVYVMPVTWTTVDQALACHQQVMQQLLACRHPNPVAITGEAQEIARLQLIRSQVMDAGLRQLAYILTPEQCARLTTITGWHG